MRAILAKAVGTPEDLIIEDLPSPVPGPGEVAVDIAAAAVNFPDLLVIEGKYQFIPPHPFCPGKEGAGTVAALGRGVGGLSIGDRVMVQAEWGTFCEQMVVPQTHCFPIPDGMAFDEAAAIGVAYQTAHFALVARAAVQPGERVLVSAATGSVGIAAIQLAKAFGCTVLAGVTTMSKADIARQNGADHVIDLSGGDLKDTMRHQIKDATGMVDVVIEMVRRRCLRRRHQGVGLRRPDRGGGLHRRTDRDLEDQLCPAQEHRGHRRELVELPRPRPGPGTARSEGDIRALRRRQDLGAGPGPVRDGGLRERLRHHPRPPDPR